VKVEQSDRHRGRAYSCWGVAKQLYVVFRAKEHRQKHAALWDGPQVLSSHRGQKRKEKWESPEGGEVSNSVEKKQNADLQE